jgi:hypothetical protein
MKMLQKDYETGQEFLADYETTLKLGGLMLETPESVEVRQPLKVIVRVEARDIAELEAEAVYTAPTERGHQVGLEFKGNWAETLEKAHGAMSSGDGERAQRWGKDSGSVYHQVQNMTPHEKIQLALRGGREERRVLMKDSQYSVHAYVLKNPKITTEEVAKIAQITSLTSEMIKTITMNHEWMQNRNIRLAIVKNPKTPATIVQKHIGRLSDNELLQIAKSENVRKHISAMARRMLSSRGKRIR